jgi:hypothetical protein
LRRDFPHPSSPAPDPTQSPVQGVPGPFLRGEEAEAWRYHPPPSRADVKERVELYLYSLSGLRGLFYGEILYPTTPVHTQSAGEREREKRERKRGREKRERERERDGYSRPIFRVLM